MRREYQIGVRLTPKERYVLKAICILEGLKPSEAIRLLIREGAAKRELPPLGVSALGAILERRGRSTAHDD